MDCLEKLGRLSSNMHIDIRPFDVIVNGFSRLYLPFAQSMVGLDQHPRLV